MECLFDAATRGKMMERVVSYERFGISENPHTSALIVIPSTITFTLQPPHAIITPTTTTFRALGFAADDYVRIDIERLT